MRVFFCPERKKKAAAKVAGNELHGLISYFGTNVDGLSFPLMCLLGKTFWFWILHRFSLFLICFLCSDYKGFRLVCSSLLPISKNTLVYGSQNAGKNFVNSDSNLYDAVTEASRILNLKVGWRIWFLDLKFGSYVFAIVLDLKFVSMVWKNDLDLEIWFDSFVWFFFSCVCSSFSDCVYRAM